MSSDDYITRLRGELLRAGATAPARRRRARVWHGLRPVGFAAAAAVTVVAVVLALGDGGGGERIAPAGETEAISYRVEPAAAADATARVLRERFASAKVEGARVSVTTGGGLTITAPEAARADVAALTQPGRFAIYDWESSVLGPDGKPAPGDESVTGGQNAGHDAALTAGEAAARSTGRPVHTGDRWFVLGGTPPLTNTHIAKTVPTTDPMNDAPIVTLEFTPLGAATFTRLTREISHRGADQALRPEAAWQHLAFVVDDRLFSVPFIDFRQAPDGIDGTTGAQISGDLTAQGARRLSVVLNSGPLPGTLEAR